MQRQEESGSTIGGQEKFENGDEQFVGGISKSEKNVTNAYCVTLDVEGVPLRLKVDTGALANILLWCYYKTLQNRPTLKRTSVRLISYTGDTLPTIGQCDLHVKDQCLEFFIVSTDQSPILGLKASQTFGLIKVVFEHQQNRRHSNML